MTAHPDVSVRSREELEARVLELEDALRACRIYARRAMVAHDVIRPLADIGNTTAIALHLDERTDVSEKEYQAFYAARKESTP